MPSSYAAYFASLDALAARPMPGDLRARQPILVPGERRAARTKLVTELEKEWPASAIKAYFYLAMSLNAGWSRAETAVDAMLSTHSEDLSLNIALRRFSLFSMEASRDLIGEETGFGEVHFPIGQRAILNGKSAAPT